VVRRGAGKEDTHASAEGRLAGRVRRLRPDRRGGSEPGWCRPGLRRPIRGEPCRGPTFTHDGVELYYEVYGTGDPLLLIHGNGSSIGSLAAQIDHFRPHYRVVAMDSRDQGRSGDSPDEITYEKMTDDLAALLDHLKTGRSTCWAGATGHRGPPPRHPASRQGEEDRRHGGEPEPGEDALRPEFFTLVRSLVDVAPAPEKETPRAGGS